MKEGMRKEDGPRNGRKKLRQVGGRAPGVPGWLVGFLVEFGDAQQMEFGSDLDIGSVQVEIRGLQQGASRFLFSLHPTCWEGAFFVVVCLVLFKQRSNSSQVHFTVRCGRGS